MGGTVRLMPSERSTSVTTVPVGARILPDGRFEFPNVPSGQYVIHADRGRSNSWTEVEFGMLPVAVNGADVTNLLLKNRLLGDLNATRKHYDIDASLTQHLACRDLDVHCGRYRERHCGRRQVKR